MKQRPDLQQVRWHYIMKVSMSIGLYRHSMRSESSKLGDRITTRYGLQWDSYRKKVNGVTIGKTNKQQQKKGPEGPFLYES
jgi:hypothetical protein